MLQYNCSTKIKEIDEANGSLMHVACDIGNEAIVKSLIEKGKLDVNIEGTDLFYLLHGNYFYKLIFFYR